MAKQKSRPKRWEEAASKASSAILEALSKIDDLERALSDLKEVQDEYSEWKDNLPDNMQSSAVAEKLEAICDLSIEDGASSSRDALEELQGIIEEAEQIDLPRGFGRD